jgi:hypothetical protein
MWGAIRTHSEGREKKIVRKEASVRDALRHMKLLYNINENSMTLSTLCAADNALIQEELRPSKAYSIGLIQKFQI